MIRYPASTPDTPRPADWRDDGACLPHDPELWFPVGYSPAENAKAAKAKRICSVCPVRQACLDHSQERRIEFGIYGGHDEDERRAMRSSGRKPATVRTGTGPKPGSISELFAQRAIHLPDGHIGWKGDVNVTFQGRGYTARQISFILDRGHAPTGNILAECDHKGCIQALHIVDAEERGRCGTQTGYRRHLARGESCEKCRDANAAADRRLRETGTTKTLVR